MGNVNSPIPPIWNMGNTKRLRSPEVKSSATLRLTTFQKLAPWLRMAPFGLPVVPAVYMIICGVSKLGSGLISGSDSDCSDSRDSYARACDICFSPKTINRLSGVVPFRPSASATRSASKNRVSAPLSFKLKANSVGVSLQFSGTRIKPSLAAAMMTSTNSMQLYDRILMRSPNCNPDACNTLARQLTLRFS